MEREPEFRENKETQKYCPRCGGKVVIETRLPDIDNAELSLSEIIDQAEHIYVCTSCGFERSEDLERMDYVFNHERWRAKNNALPDVIVPRKVHVTRQAHILEHHPFPNRCIYLYNPFLLSEIVSAKREFNR